MAAARDYSSTLLTPHSVFTGVAALAPETAPSNAAKPSVPDPDVAAESFAAVLEAVAVLFFAAPAPPTAPSKAARPSAEFPVPLAGAPDTVLFPLFTSDPAIAIPDPPEVAVAVEFLLPLVAPTFIPLDPPMFFDPSALVVIPNSPPRLLLPSPLTG